MTTHLANSIFSSSSLQNSLAILNHTDPDLIRTAWFNIDRFAEHFPAEAHELLGTAPGNLQPWRHEELVLKISALADPRQALTEALNSHDSADRETVIRSSLRNLAVTDLASALELLPQIDPELLNYISADTLVNDAITLKGRDYSTTSEAYRKRIAATFETLQALHPAGVPADLLAPILAAAGGGSSTPEIHTVAEEIVDLATGASDVDLNTLSTALHLIGRTDPARATDAARQVVGNALGYPRSANHGKLQSAFAYLQSGDPTYLHSLLPEISGSPLAPTAVTVVLNTSLHDDPAAAIGWASNLPLSDISSESAQILADTALYIDPVQALAWAQKIEHTRTRQSISAEAYRIRAAIEPGAPPAP